MFLSRRVSRFALYAMAVPALATLPVVPAGAQATYGPPGPEAADTDRPETDIPLLEAERCEETVRADGTIVVCRELPETERYLSPIPRAVRSDRRIITGLTDPPCWVTNPGPGCIRMGWAPEPVLMVDLAAIPEPLDENEAARVTGERGAAAPPAEPGVGRRVPIDISQD